MIYQLTLKMRAVGFLAYCVIHYAKGFRMYLQTSCFF